VRSRPRRSDAGERTVSRRRRPGRGPPWDGSAWLSLGARVRCRGGSPRILPRRLIRRRARYRRTGAQLMRSRSGRASLPPRPERTRPPGAELFGAERRAEAGGAGVDLPRLLVASAWSPAGSPDASTRDMASGRGIALRATMRKARPTFCTSEMADHADQRYGREGADRGDGRRARRRHVGNLSTDGQGRAP
jgi:hypothetical protein